LKTAHDPRHIRRVKAVKSLFAYTFSEDQSTESKLARRVIKNLDKINKIITDCAPEWPVSQINRLDLCVLRLAVYELLYKKNTPPKVIIDEAIEIGKQFGSQSSGSFINGVLASALKATNRESDIETQDQDKNEKQSEKENEK
jgi:transcription antitermination protein NusB